MLFAMALLFGLFSLVHWFAAAMALFAAGIGVYSLVMGVRGDPVLSVGPQGLHYARFSSRTVPWSEIDEVAVVRGVTRGVAWGKAYHKPNPATDEIAFSLKDYNGYAAVLSAPLRALRTTFGAPAVPCYVWHLENTTADDIAKAIAPLWQGQIQDLVPRDGKFERTNWTGTPPKVA